MPANCNAVLAQQLPCYLILLASLFSSAATLTAATNLTTEAETLLHFKNGLTQADKRLSGWTAANLAGVCNTWQGVFCSPENASVIKLNFTGFNVSGLLTPPLCDLPNLAEIHLRSNSFSQPFPSFILQFCGELTVIDFSLNSFSGPLPVAISSALPKLQVFNMEGNSFNGTIPPDLGNLSQLRLLRLRGNSLSGPFPPELGRLTLLQILDLSWNSYDAQEIPHFFTNLSSLQELDIPGCQLTGQIPAFLANLSHHLWFLDLSENNLSGSIPVAILGNLHKLQQLYLYSNHFTGPVPPFNSDNFPNISILHLQNNSLSGPIPGASLASLSSLNTLRLDSNYLSGELPDDLSSLPNLAFFLVFSNNLSGSISSKWGLNSPLIQFDVTENQFTGTFPPNLCHGNDLLYLSLKNNKFTGGIPLEYNDCTSVLRFVVDGNQLSGKVPSGLWALPNLQVVMLQKNLFNGEITLPESDASSKPANLQSVFLDSNQFEGPLPSEIGQFWVSLGKLTASQNKLAGQLPAEIGRLANLTQLDLSRNAISGEIPASIGNCTALNILTLSYNNLSGAIPAQLGQLQNLNFIDLSNNHLNGSIPTSLGEQIYSIFDVANNDLSGIVPGQLAKQLPSSFEGNKNLCFPDEPCVWSNGSQQRSGKTNVRLLVPIVVLGACAILLCVALMRRRKQMKLARMEGARDWTMVSFQSLGFREEELYDSLDEKNVIGWGSSGTVYKVFLEGGAQVVAVKKLTNCRAWNSGNIVRSGFHMHKRVENLAFNAEMEILGKVKHRNIVKLMCSCSSKDAKLLVYEYMCNGSLGDVLHKAFRNELLCWATRFEIALGAAEGLAYLHHGCVPPILHRDIKANNILLDSSFQAKLADFGVAKMFQGRTPMTSVVGSVGYIAPEYAYTLKVDEKSDVYSYGVVLLELVAGRSPASKGMENDGVDLVRWVGQLAQSKESIWKVFDCRMDVCESDKESMLSVLKIALLCTCTFPRQRPSMREVVELLHRASPINTLPTHHHQDPARDKSKHITVSVMT